MRLSIVLGAVLVTATWYFTWRLTTFNQAHPLWSWVFFMMELGAFAWSLLFLLTVRSLPNHEVPPAPPRLRVDVVVTTYNEPLEIVRRTVMAALEITYPHETWLLDDGARDEMRRMAGALGCRYLARTNNVEAKAGNLNHALPYLRGDFIAMFDADHVAHPRFLDRTLGFFEDEHLAFVQTPQEFFNVDSYQHFDTSVSQRAALHEQSLFFHVIQRGRDLVNATMLCGTCAVIRRSALDEVGGFATGSITEDMKTSVRLHAAGWRSLFLPEILSAGIAPFDGRDFRRQRLRWAQGAMQVLVQENVLFHPHLSAGQRLHYVLHTLNQIEGWRHAAMFFLPAIVLLTAFSPVNASPLPYALHFLPYFGASVLSYEEFGRGYGRFVEGEIYNLARCSISMQATFAFLHRSLPFRVTAKTRRAGSDWIGMALPWSVVILTVFALADALVAVARGTSHFPGASLAIIAGWAIFALYIAARAIGRAARCSRDRRTESRSPLDLYAQIGGYRARVLALSADGITLACESGVADGPAAVAVEIGGRRFVLDARLVRRFVGTLGGRLHWNDEHECAAFDLALHQAHIRALASLTHTATETNPCESLVTSLSR